MSNELIQLVGDNSVQGSSSKLGYTSIVLKPWRYLGAAMLSLGIALPRIPGHSDLQCPLLKSTGIPCPFCGMTTTVEATMRGHVDSALAANPFAIPLVVIAIALLLLPKIKAFQVRTIYIKMTIPAVLMSSWIFELFRFHVL